jgi:hypothetical protein
MTLAASVIWPFRHRDVRDRNPAPGAMSGTCDGSVTPRFRRRECHLQVSCGASTPCRQPSSGGSIGAGDRSSAKWHSQRVPLGTPGASPRSPVRRSPVSANAAAFARAYERVVAGRSGRGRVVGEPPVALGDDRRVRDRASEEGPLSGCLGAVSGLLAGALRARFGLAPRHRPGCLVCRAALPQGLALLAGAPGELHAPSVRPAGAYVQIRAPSACATVRAFTSDSSYSSAGSESATIAPPTCR